MRSGSFLNELYDPSHFSFLNLGKCAAYRPFDHPSYFTPTILHPMVSIAVPLCDSYSTLLPQRLLSNDRPGQESFCGVQTLRFYCHRVVYILFIFILLSQGCIYVFTVVYIYIYIYIFISKVADWGGGRPECSLFISYYTNVSRRALLVSLDCSIYPWSVHYNAECYARRHQVQFWSLYVGLVMGLNLFLPSYWQILYPLDKWYICDIIMYILCVIIYCNYLLSQLAWNTENELSDRKSTSKSKLKATSQLWCTSRY